MRRKQGRKRLVNMQITVSEENSLELGLARWLYTRSTYKLRPITASTASLVPIKISEKEEANGANFHEIPDTSIEYRFGRRRYERVSRNRKIPLGWKSIGRVTRLILRMIGSQYPAAQSPFLLRVRSHESSTKGRGTNECRY